MPNPRIGPRLGAGVALATAFVLCLLPTGSADAAPSAPRPPNSWGAGAYPYLDGMVCKTLAGTPAQISTPLVSWDLGNAGAPAFLREPVTSAAGIDSAAPPLPTVGPQTNRNIAPGDLGFASRSDIATYATLISRYGTGGGAQQTAEVAHAVLAASGGTSSGVSGRVPACDDTIAEAALVQQARRLAGPYTVTVGGGNKPVLPGSAQDVTATVRSAAGKPVPDVQVNFAAPGGELSAAAATTAADGTATVRLTVPLGTDRAAIPVRARIALPTGLDEVTATANPTPTDPTGAVAPAVLASAPVAVSAAGKVPVDRSAHPVLSIRAAPAALVVGTSSSPRVHLTGMYGHRATLQVVVAGPVPLSKHTLCRNVQTKDFARTAATTYTLQTTGDVTTDAGRWAPQHPGCYRVTANLVTQDAIPRAHADAVTGEPVTVLDTTATTDPSVPLVSPGDNATGSVRLTDAYGLGGTVQVRLAGPVLPQVGARECAGADFARAPVGPATSTQLAADAVHPVAQYSLRTSAVGCYRVTGAAVLHLPDGPAVRVPIGASAAPALLAIAPRISYSMTRLWAYQRGAVSAQATVIGTFNAPAHVALRLQHVPDSSRGCRSAHFAGATQSTTGPSVPIDSDLQTVSVSSGPLTARGCYAPVPVLTMDGNPSVTATGRFVALRSAVEVGLDPRTMDHADMIDARTISRSAPIRWWTGLVFIALAGVAVAFAWACARRERRAIDRSGR